MKGVLTVDKGLEIRADRRCVISTFQVAESRGLRGSTCCGFTSEAAPGASDEAHEGNSRRNWDGERLT